MAGEIPLLNGASIPSIVGTTQVTFPYDNPYLQQAWGAMSNDTRAQIMNDPMALGAFYRMGTGLQNGNIAYERAPDQYWGTVSNYDSGFFRIPNLSERINTALQRDSGLFGSEIQDLYNNPMSAERTYAVTDPYVYASSDMVTSKSRPINASYKTNVRNYYYQNGTDIGHSSNGGEGDFYYNEAHYDLYPHLSKTFDLLKSDPTTYGKLFGATYTPTDTSDFKASNRYVNPSTYLPKTPTTAKDIAGLYAPAGSIEQGYNVPVGLQGGASAAGNSFYGQEMQDDTMPVYGYAEGGLVGDPNTGTPMVGTQMQQGMGMPPMGVQTPRQLPYAEIDAEINRFMQQHPEQVQQIQQLFLELVMSGELTPDALNMMGQLATAALQNPQLYPQLRQYAIQQGFGDEESIPEQYDQGLLVIVVLAARATMAALQGQDVQMVPTQPQQPMASYAKGGLVTPGTHAARGGKVAGPGTGTSDSVPIRVSAGEYVIPEHVVRAKGTEFFDKMLSAYDPAQQGKK